MPSLEHVFSLKKIAMTFFLVYGFFLFFAAYITEYESKWKIEYESIFYAFYNFRTQNSSVRQCETVSENDSSSIQFNPLDTTK